MAADRRELARLMTDGAAAAKRGDFAAAAAAFARAVAHAPELAAAHMNLGNALRRVGRVDEAAASLTRAAALDPRAALPQYNLGNALVDLGRLEDAAAAFRAALELEPGLVAAQSNLGDALLRLGRHAEALACFEAVLAADPAAPHAQHNRLAALNNLCLGALRRGAADEALALCERYLALSPANRKPLAYKAVALIELGRRDEAAELLDFARLILRKSIAVPAGYASVAAFDAELAAFAERHPSLQFEPPDKSTVGGSQTGELLREPSTVTAALDALIRAAIPEYIARLRAALPAHPYTLGLPERWRLATWAVVLRSAGHQGPHFHPDGYISGVYYARLPSTMRDAADHAGWLEFGRTGDAIGNREDPLIELVRPAEGLLLLFPSYFYHRTIPFEGAEPRISVAFDVLPL